MIHNSLEYRTEGKAIMSTKRRRKAKNWDLVLSSLRAVVRVRVANVRVEVR
jgi:hypothetical protein